MEHEQLVRKAGGGDVKAFVELTRRFQQFAFGSALTLVHDFQHAEDVVQEAFVAAWSGLPSLADPAAFPGWLRGIVRHHAFRVLRRKQLSAVPLADAEEVPDEKPLPDHILDARRQAAAALAAISELPDRLHAARSHLKQRMLTMVTDTLHAHALPDDFANRIGRLIETRGDVVDALFDPAALPDLMTELTVSDEARKDGLKVYVMQRPGGGVVRGLAASALPLLPKGATVLSSRRRSQSAIDPMQLDRLVPLPAAATSNERRTDEVVETGIKVIDVMCPIRAGGSVAIAGEYGTGNTVVMEEIVRRISKSVYPVTIFVLIPPPSEAWPPSLDENYSFADALKAEGYSEGTVDAVQTFFLRGVDKPWTADTLASLAAVDTVVLLSREMILRKTYPAVDVRMARSRLIDENRIAAREVAIARAARDAIAAARMAEDHPDLAHDPVLIDRAHKLQAFFSQPFDVAESYTKPRAPMSAAPTHCGAATKSSTAGTMTSLSRPSISPAAWKKFATPKARPDFRDGSN
jgi:RNA polymerase sigma factor (sigma-70 family)